MRIVKLAFISFLFFAALLFCMSLLLPSSVRLSKAINLARADSGVLRQISDTASWKNWHPLYQTSQSPVRVPKTITDSLVVIEMAQGAGRTITNSWALHRFGPADSITLQWYMDFKLSLLPWHRFSSLFYEPTYGRVMEKGLRNLKAVQAEKR